MPVQYQSAQWLLPVSAEPIENGCIAYENGRVVAVMPVSDLPDSVTVPPVVPGSLLTPGLVNSHIHLEQSFPEPILKDPEEPFTNWLNRVTQANRTYAGTEQKRARCLAGTEEVLSTGTTCVNDISGSPESLRVLDEKGLRGLLSIEFFHPGNDPVDVSGIIAAYRELCQGYERHPRLKTGLSPHTPYNVSPAAWKQVLDACDPPVVHTHVAESGDEVLYLQGKPSHMPELHRLFAARAFAPPETAASPVRYLHRFGLLTDRTIMAHVVFTDAGDRGLLAEAGVTVAHCPRSNIALHGETLRYADWQDSDVPFGLGTDGRLSTENLDLRAEARYAMELHQLSAGKMLEMMTLDGARALRLENETGTLAPGKWADWVLWQADFTQGLSPEEMLLHPDTRAQTVCIGGEIRWAR